MRWRLKPRRQDVPGCDLSPGSRKQVLAEGRVPITSFSDCRGHVRPAWRVRELTARCDLLALHRGSAAQRRSGSKRGAPILRARPVDEAADCPSLDRRSSGRVVRGLTDPVRRQVCAPSAIGAVGASRDEQRRQRGRDRRKDGETDRNCRSGHGRTVQQGRSAYFGGKAVERCHQLYIQHTECEEQDLIPLAEKHFSPAKLESLGRGMAARRGLPYP